MFRCCIVFRFSRLVSAKYSLGWWSLVTLSWHSWSVLIRSQPSHGVTDPCLFSHCKPFNTARFLCWLGFAFPARCRVGSRCPSSWTKSPFKTGRICRYALGEFFYPLLYTRGIIKIVSPILGVYPNSILNYYWSTKLWRKLKRLIFEKASSFLTFSGRSVCKLRIFISG